MASRNFCTTAELAAELGDPDLGVIDGSWHLPNTGRLGEVEFRAGHIPGAVFFDIDTIADHDQGLPHMLPKPEALAEEMTRARARRRHALRRLRRARPVRGGAGLVDAARLWRRGRPHPRRRPAEMDRRRPAARDRRRRTRARARSRRGSTKASSPRSSEVREALATGSAQVVDARSGRTVPRRSARAAAGPQERPHARQPQPALRRHRRARLAQSPGRAQGRRSPSTGSISRSPSSPPAARASARRSWRSRSRRPAARSPASTTARGPNGAGATTARSRPGRPERGPRARH